MKNIFIAFLFLPLFNWAQTPEAKVVEAFLHYSKRATENKPVRRSYVLPSAIKALEAGGKKAKVNMFSPADFVIRKQEGNKVYAIIWGTGKRWVYELVFEVVKENGQLFLKPTDTEINEYGYFSSYTANRDTERNKKILATIDVSKQIAEREKVYPRKASYSSVVYKVKETPEVKCVRRFLNEIDNSKRKSKTAMKKYIAPSYHAKIYLKRDISCGSFGKHFKIIGQRGDTVEAYIWPEGKKIGMYVYRHDFKVVREQGAYYILPMSASRFHYQCTNSRSAFINSDEVKALKSEHKDYKEPAVVKESESFKEPNSPAAWARFIKKEFAKENMKLVWQKKILVMKPGEYIRLGGLRTRKEYRILYIGGGDSKAKFKVKSKSDVQEFNSNSFQKVQTPYFFYSVNIGTGSANHYITDYQVSSSKATSGEIMIFELPAQTYKGYNKNKGLMNLVPKK